MYTAFVIRTILPDSASWDLREVDQHMTSSPHPQRRYRTGDQNWVRERNLSIVLRYIWEAGQPIA